MKLEAKLREALKLPCVDKRRYDSLEEATAVAQQRTHASTRDYAKFLQPYPCDQGCGGFHLTSRPFRDKLAEYPVIGEWKP